MTIRFRLTMWYTALLAVVLLVLGTTLYVSLSAKLTNDVKRLLINQAEDVKSEIRYIEIWRILTLPSLEGFQSASMFIQAMTFSNGRLSSNLSNVTLKISDSALDHAQSGQDLFETGYLRNSQGRMSPIMIYSTPIFVRSEPVGILQVATPIDNVYSTLRSLRFTLFLLGGLGLVLAATLGWWMARNALKPVDDIIEAAQQIESGADLSRRIEYRGPDDELGRLVRTINGMLARLHQAYTELEEAYRNQRRFVSDASHELRTPLTTIRGNIDLLGKVWSGILEREQSPDKSDLKLTAEALSDIAGEAERMSRLVNDMLALARADAGYQMEMKPVELAPLLEEVSRRANFLPRTAEWLPERFDLLSGVYVRGNRDYLQQMLFIFIENAFKYTPEGHVRMEAIVHDQQAGIKISDTGMGMDKEEVPHIFERFYRADVSRGRTQGTGLGLSIAKWIIDQHHGSVEVFTALGKGTTFIVWLPIERREVLEEAGD